MLLHFVRSFAQTSTTEERVAAILEHFSTRRSLSEAEVRAELVNRGLPATEVDAWIARARRTREMLTQIGSDAFVFERITRTGYCNEDGQEVILCSVGRRRFMLPRRQLRTLTLALLNQVAV